MKAIGVELRSQGLVQVSMNLTNHEETPLHKAFAAVQRERQLTGGGRRNRTHRSGSGAGTH